MSSFHLQKNELAASTCAEGTFNPRSGRVPANGLQAIRGMPVASSSLVARVPNRLEMLGGSEFRLRRGFGPLAQNARDAALAASPMVGMYKNTPEQRSGVFRIGRCRFLLHALGHSNSSRNSHTVSPSGRSRLGTPIDLKCSGGMNPPSAEVLGRWPKTLVTPHLRRAPWSVCAKTPRSSAPGCFVSVDADSYFMLSATATAVATVIPTMGLLPAPRKPIIST